jgi:hypothetical protein
LSATAEQYPEREIAGLVSRKVDAVVLTYSDGQAAFVVASVIAAVELAREAGLILMNGTEEDGLLHWQRHGNLSGRHR